MKSLNKTKELWNNLSAKEVEESNYQSLCCFNVQVSHHIQNDAEGKAKTSEGIKDQ